MKKSIQTHAAPDLHSRSYDSSGPWKVGCLLLAVLFIVSIITGGFGFSGSSDGNTQQIVQAPSPAGNPGPQVKAELKEDGDPAIGDKSAPVTIYEFSDYQCPFCERAFQQTYPEVMKLVKAGKVRYILKDFPLPFHAQALSAATTAECAGKQNKYWEMHDLLFQKQQEWSSLTDATTTFKNYAQSLGLDSGKFDKCIADPNVLQEVQGDLAEGNAAGVSGTPTFYINGIQLVGAQPWSAFEQIINQELSK